MDYLETWGYFGLFLASFLAGSFIPFSAEAIISTLLYKGFSLSILVAVATLGNWFGGYTAFYMGYFGRWDLIKKYFKTSPEIIDKFQKKSWNIELLAFFCWIPFAGTLILIGLGIMRSSIIKIGVYMFVGRMSRYLLWGILSKKIITLI
jgi:membrane protein YqaA with SNARE-associated domain